jgi:hypothetical protein
LSDVINLIHFPEDEGSLGIIFRRGNVPYMEYAPNVEYQCSGETKSDNTVLDHQIDSWVKKT